MKSNRAYKEENTIILGNTLTIDTDCDASEIKADIKVSEFETLRVWGQVLNCNNQPVQNALVKLVKVVKHCGQVKLEGVAHTITDCNGFYQFDICKKDKHHKFKILVSKAATGEEFVIDNIDGECNSCNEHNPCTKPRKPHYYEDDCYLDCDNSYGHHNGYQKKNNFLDYDVNHNWNKDCYVELEPVCSKCGVEEKRCMCNSCTKCGKNKSKCTCKRKVEYTASNQCGCHI